MLAQPDCFTLHFEIPAIRDGLLPQLAIGGEVARPIVAAPVRDLLAGRFQLRDEPLETAADPGQRGGAFLLQFLEQALMLGPSRVLTHAPIMPDSQRPRSRGGLSLRLTLTSTEAKMPRTARFGQNVLTNNYDPELLKGWGVRSSDWSVNVAVQQQILPRASVEVAYSRRSFNGFTVNDNQL